MMAGYLSHWEARLDAFVTARLHQPFVWGVQDCALFAADAVQAITGMDLAHDLRGYRTARQAMRLVRSRGGLRSVVSAKLGEAIDARYACHGDVALVRMGSSDALGIVLHGGRVIGPGALGLHTASIASARLAWRVG